MAEWIYRLMLRAYPVNFRRQYEMPMMQHFRDQRRSTKVLPFWWRIAWDWVRTVPARHWERLWPSHGHSRLSVPVRDAMFFARLEASSFGRREISVEHLLLGLLRNDEALRTAFGPEGVSGAVREIEASEAVSRRTPPREELPLSAESKRVVGLALLEAQAVAEPQVTASHLVRAILQQEPTLAAGLLRRYL
jgi:hypothetical protein